MVALDPVMTHEEVQQVLPWYANKRLDAQTMQRVEAHLAACAICRGDIDGLNAVFSGHEQSSADRPVDEARLDALFARIDRHETERRQQTRGDIRPGLIARAMRWLTVNPALAASSMAAVLLAVFMAPAMLQERVVDNQFSVLGSKDAASEPFAIQVRFNEPAEKRDLERLIASILQASSDVPAYRVEQHSATDYTIVFASKPSVVVASELLAQLTSSTNVAEARIDVVDGFNPRPN